MFPDITVREMLATGILHQLRPRLTCAARTQGRVLQDCLQHISLDDRPDARLLDSPGRPTFSSRDAYRAIQGEALEQDAMRIWATWLPTKVKFFSWLLVRGRLNTSTTGTSGLLRTHGASTAMGSPKRMSTSSLVAAELKRFGLASAFPFKPGLSGGRGILAPASRFLMLSVSTPSF